MASNLPPGVSPGNPHFNDDATVYELLCRDASPEDLRNAYIYFYGSLSGDRILPSNNIALRMLLTFIVDMLEDAMDQSQPGSAAELRTAMDAKFAHLTPEKLRAKFILIQAALHI